MGNRSLCQNILTLNIAKLSHSYLKILHRSDFWDSLPHPKTLVLLVSLDWHRYEQAASSAVSLVSIEPSTASRATAWLLSKHIAPKSSVNSLVVSYTGGGEHTSGLYARNRHILPAPIDTGSYSGNVTDLVLPHIEHLTFSNCWFTAHILKGLVQYMATLKLQTLKLDSVSLIASRSDRDYQILAAKPDEAYALNSWLPAYGLPRLYWHYGREEDTLNRAGDRTLDQHAQSFYQHYGSVDEDGAIEANLALPHNRECDPLDDPPMPDDDFTWLEENSRVHTWPSVINAITPGLTVSDHRISRLPAG